MFKQAEQVNIFVGVYFHAGQNGETAAQGGFLHGGSGADLFEFGQAGEQGRRAHDLARLAVAALRHVVVDPRLLHGREHAVLRQAAAQGKTIFMSTHLLDMARDIKANPHHFADSLKGKTLALIFEKPSTRTRAVPLFGVEGRPDLPDCYVRCGGDASRQPDHGRRLGRQGGDRGARRVEGLPPRLGEVDLVEEDADRAAMFQYMISNTDWRIKSGHNTKFMKSLTEVTPKVFPVPYDFDFSAFVDAAYAFPQEWSNTETLYQRDYLGYCRSDDNEYLKIISLFLILFSDCIKCNR